MCPLWVEAHGNCWETVSAWLSSSGSGGQWWWEHRAEAYQPWRTLDMRETEAHVFSAHNALGVAVTTESHNLSWLKYYTHFMDMKTTAETSEVPCLQKEARKAWRMQKALATANQFLGSHHPPSQVAWGFQRQPCPHAPGRQLQSRQVSTSSLLFSLSFSN
jgi:hypothetical protein